MTFKNGMDPVHPGKILRDELVEIGISARSLAAALNVPPNRITAILNGERGITADTALRLGRYFDTTAQLWLNLQQSWEVRTAEIENGAQILERVVPRETKKFQEIVTDLLATKTLPDATATTVRAIEHNLALCDALVDAENSLRIDDRNPPLLRILESPLEELCRSGVFATALGERLSHTSQWLSIYESLFRVPSSSEISSLLSAFSTELSPSLDSIKTMLTSLRSPWFNSQDKLGSIERLISLNSIGEVVSSPSSYVADLAECLRRSLGDWRDPISWSDLVLFDLEARIDRYVDFGFDTALTDLPSSAFRETTTIANVRSGPPPLIEEYALPEESSDQSFETRALSRTNLAHGWLQSLESQLRQYIDRHMTDAFGSDWPTVQLPPNKCDEWLEKKEQARQSGAPTRRLIGYADFTDYATIMCWRDNWTQIFRQHFEQEEILRESFQRLYPIRRDTLLARPVTQADELLLYVETKRLMRRITASGTSPSPVLE